MNRLDLLLKSKVVKYLDKHHITPTPPVLPYLTLTAVDGDVEMACGTTTSNMAEYCFTTDDPTDESNWNGYMFSANPVPVQEGKSIYVRSVIDRHAQGSGGVTSDDYNFVFTGSGKVKASGDIKSMLRWSEGNIYPYCFSRMFKGCSALIQAPELPFTELADYCYSKMFEGCYALVNAPVLPATSLKTGCYEEMFNQAAGLSSASIYASASSDSCYGILSQVWGENGVLHVKSGDTSWGSYLPQSWSISQDL